MIKVNLAKKKQSANAVAPESQDTGAVSTGGLGGFRLPVGLSKITLDSDQLKELPYKKFVIAITAAVIATYFIDNQKEVEMQTATEIVTKLIAERTQLSASAGKIKNYEALKKTMEADEATIRGKIETIQKLIADRANPPKVLRSLATAIPKDVWLADFHAGEKEFTLRGFSIGINQITSFINSLNESAYFKDVSLRNGSAMQQVKDETGADVYSLDLTANRR